MMAGRDLDKIEVAGGPAGHIPVMLPEVLQSLKPQDGEIYLDGTFGAGGYTKAILDSADCVVVAVDRDPNAIAGGSSLVSEYQGRLNLVEGRYGQMDKHVTDLGYSKIDGVVLDIGVSSMQLDQAERGFSFVQDGPLDMRMEQDGLSAADVINSYDEKDLAAIFWLLGEEKRSRAIARAIVDQRTRKMFERTGELATLVSNVLGGAAQKYKIHPATRTFQALRLYVNRELEELVDGLFAAEAILKEGGRLVVVTFHSLEDRIVKRFLAKGAGREGAGSRHLPEQKKIAPSLVNKHLGSKTPLESEIDRNPRARSARLRFAVRSQNSARFRDGQGLGLPKLLVKSSSSGGVIS